MGFRFRKRIGLFGGMVHVNLSKTGISLSAGPRDANINVDLSGRRKHPRATVGIPGSGLTYQTDLGGVERQQPHQPQFVAPAEPGSKVLRNIVMLIIALGICLLLLASAHAEQASPPPLPPGLTCTEWVQRGNHWVCNSRNRNSGSEWRSGAARP